MRDPLRGNRAEVWAREGSGDDFRLEAPGHVEVGRAFNGDAKKATFAAFTGLDPLFVLDGDNVRPSDGLVYRLEDGTGRIIAEDGTDLWTESAP